MLLSSLLLEAADHCDSAGHADEEDYKRDEPPEPGKIVAIVVVVVVVWYRSGRWRWRGRRRVAISTCRTAAAVHAIGANSAD